MKTHHDHAEITAGLEHAAPKVGEHFSKPGPRRVRAGGVLTEAELSRYHNDLLSRASAHRQHADVPPKEGAGWVTVAAVLSIAGLLTMAALEYFGVLR